MKAPAEVSAEGYLLAAIVSVTSPDRGSLDA
jgi:hypothetical protein